jgi:hypothetical protein
MTSKERVLSAINREESDRVPYCEMLVDRSLAQKLMGWGSPESQRANLEANIYSIQESKEIASFLKLDNIGYVLRAPVYAHKIPGKDGRLFYGEGMILAESDLPKLKLPGPYDNSLYAEAVDLNNDGLLDLIFARDPGNNGAVPIENYTGPERPDEYYQDIVYINNGQFGGKDNHWLKLTFTGLTDAELAGARVLAYPAGTIDKTDATLLGMRVVFSNQHHKSGTPLQVHFGLGAENKADIKVILISGKTVAVKGITANKKVEIDLSRGS